MIHKLGRIWGGFFRGANAYASVMAAEEILDMMQRDFMKDERVQPVTRTVSKIHVLEEARHIRFAREEVGRRIQAPAGPASRSSGSTPPRSCTS